MIKLSEVIDKEFQPSEKAKMKNFLKRGSRDQENVYKEPGIYEDSKEVMSNPHPENHNSSQRYNNGYPWSFNDPSSIFEGNEAEKIHQAMIGREFQTMDDVKKMVSRLQTSGFATSEILDFILNYIS